MANECMTLTDFIKSAFSLEDIMDYYKVPDVYSGETDLSILKSEMVSVEQDLSILITSQKLYNKTLLDKAKFFNKLRKTINNEASFETYFNDHIRSTEDGDSEVKDKKTNFIANIFRKIGEFLRKIVNFIGGIIKKLSMRIKSLFDGDLRNVLKAFEQHKDTKIKVSYILKGVNPETFNNIIKSMNEAAKVLSNDVKTDGGKEVSVKKTLETVLRTQVNFKKALSTKGININGDSLSSGDVIKVIKELETSHNLYPAMFGGTPTKSENVELSVGEVFESGDQLSRMVNSIGSSQTDMAEFNKSINVVVKSVTDNSFMDAINKVENSEKRKQRIQNTLTMFSMFMSSVSRGISEYGKIINEASFAIKKKDEPENNKDENKEGNKEDNNKEGNKEGNNNDSNKK